MPTETLKFDIPQNAYLAVSNGHFNVFIRRRTPVNLRLHLGQSLPAANTEDYVLVSGPGMAFSDLEGGDKVYLMAEGADAVVTVIRGG